MRRLIGRRTWLALAAVTAMLLSPPGARAAQTLGAGHQGASRSVSYSSWTIDGATVRLGFTLPRAAARDLVPPGAPTPDAAVVASAVLASVSVDSAGGACTAIDQGEGAGQIYILALTPGFHRFEVVFACPSADGLVLHDAVLFDRVPGHVDYARVQVDGGQPSFQILTRDHQAIALRAGARPLDLGTLGRFAKQGATQLLEQADRLCLVLGLLLLARCWRDLGLIAAALGLGYLASLAAATGGFILDPSLAAAVMGLAVLLLGVNALRLQATGPPAPQGWRVGVVVAAGLIIAAVVVAAAAKSPTAGLAAGGLVVFGAAQVWTAGAAPRFRWIAFAPATLSALLDGMTPAGDLAMLQAPLAQAAPRLLAYDLGAIAAGTALAAVAMGALWLAGRGVGASRRMAAIDLAGAALVGLGLFWFVSRLYG